MIGVAIGYGREDFAADNDLQIPPYSLEYELSQLYRLDLLPQFRQGIVEQISSYDTTGLNDDGFSGKYSYLRKEGNDLVIAEMKGPGVINRIWTPTPTRDTILFYFDGETTPRIQIPFIDLFSGAVFPFVRPVCGNEVGGYYCYIPIQYAKSCKIVYRGNRIQFHQIQYRPYPEGTAVESFHTDWSNQARALLEDACDFWSGTFPNPVAQLQNAGSNVKVETRQLTLSAGESLPLFRTNKGGRIVGLELESGNALEGRNKDLLLQARWDNDTLPAIYCPLADFFGYAFGNPAMRSIIAGNNARNVNYCYLPMPFSKQAELKIIYEKRNEPQPKVVLNVKIYYLDTPQDPKIEGRLYTVWRREIEPPEHQPYLFADIRDKGHYVGVIHQAQGLRPGMTQFFEGDDSTVVDGKMRMHGTGSEDFYNGGWYALLDRWDRGVSLPIHGSLDYSLPMCRTGAYRFYLTDKLTFHERLTMTIEHGPEHNLFPVDYVSVAFYYGTKPADNPLLPNETLRTVYYPVSHVFFPQLMNLSLGGNTRIENHGRLIAATDEEGMVRIMLNDIPEGKYKLFLTYFETPDGASFSIWNRQKMIMDWKEAFSSKETRMEKQPLGELLITRQTNSISIHIRKNQHGDRFHFENLFLEKQDK
jgi:hypothetical protein